MMEDKELLRKIGANIKRIRLKKKISQVALAEMCDFEKSNLNRIEAGRTNPTATTLNKIATALDVRVMDLVR